MIDYYLIESQDVYGLFKFLDEEKLAINTRTTAEKWHVNGSWERRA
jgi:hypothetical protein